MRKLRISTKTKSTLKSLALLGGAVAGVKLLAETVNPTERSAPGLKGLIGPAGKDGVGSNGANGINGVNGTVIHSGTTPPDQNGSTVGDFHISPNGEIHLRKVDPLTLPGGAQLPGITVGTANWHFYGNFKGIDLVNVITEIADQNITIDCTRSETFVFSASVPKALTISAITENKIIECVNGSTTDLSVTFPATPNNAAQTIIVKGQQQGFALTPIQSEFKNSVKFSKLPSGAIYIIF